MRFERTITLKDGRECILKNAAAHDTEEVCRTFRQTHAETDFLLSYPDEINMTVEKESEYLSKKEESENEVEVCAFIDGKIVGMAAVSTVGGKYKTKHRAKFGISVEKAFWGLGIGKALTEACIKRAKNAGYEQLDLDVVSDNIAAINLYKSFGFIEYGRNPKGFRSRISGWQELVLMLLPLKQRK